MYLSSKNNRDFSINKHFFLNFHKVMYTMLFLLVLSGLEILSQNLLLFSCSTEGCVKMWRLDTLRMVSILLSHYSSI